MLANGQISPPTSDIHVTAKPHACHLQTKSLTSRFQYLCRNLFPQCATSLTSSHPSFFAAEFPSSCWQAAHGRMSPSRNLGLTQSPRCLPHPATPAHPHRSSQSRNRERQPREKPLRKPKPPPLRQIRGSLQPMSQRQKALSASENRTQPKPLHGGPVLPDHVPCPTRCALRPGLDFPRHLWKRRRRNRSSNGARSEVPALCLRVFMDKGNSS